MLRAHRNWCTPDESCSRAGSLNGGPARPTLCKAVGVDATGSRVSDGRAGYRRSAGSPKGEARRRELLSLVTDDLAVNGLVEFSLRRAARAAGTTHKVLLYHFNGADDLLAQAIFQLRERRIGRALEAVGRGPGAQTLAARVRGVWA